MMLILRFLLPIWLLCFVVGKKQVDKFSALKFRESITNVDNGQNNIIENDPSRIRIERIKRRVGLPRSSRFGQPCTYNTDCLQNMYCPAGACLCLPAFVDISIDCLPIINPGQYGCTVDRQCSGAWTSTKCVNGQCVCPEGSFIAETQDGLVCVAQGRCPLPEGYAGPMSSTLDTLSSDTNGCSYLDPSTSDPAACFANGQYQGDIYDCIPKAKPAILGTPGQCCPSKSLTCIQPKLTFGGTENRYWYNSITGTCEPFAWNSAGTIGNSNNFVAYEHCMSYCASTCKRGPPQLASGKALRCSGNDACSSDGQKQYSCTRTGDGQHCCPTKEFVCSAYGGRNEINNPLTSFDPGTSGGQGTTGSRWYWTGTVCQTFSYKGYAGNFNNFLTYEDCKTFCGQSLCQQGDPLKNSNGVYQQCSGGQGCPTSYECVRNVCCPKKQTVCIQPKLTGACNHPSQRYWFNSETRECETMIYSGCNGNDNNFATYLDCQNFCRETTAQPKCIHGEADKDLKTGRFATCSATGMGYKQNQCRQNYECYYDGFLFGCCPTKSYTCSLQAVPGNLCISVNVRWFYDPSIKMCKSFQFLGCNGNSNNFLTKQQCEQYCGHGLCPYGGEPYQNVRRVCTESETCPIGYRCVSAQADNIGYCCPTRAKMCSEKPDQGQQCSDPVEKFYFNPLMKQCSTFTFVGCGGNGNKFSTLSQCNNFCTSTSCNDGETAYLDPNTLQPSTCIINASSSCPVGFTCKFDQLTHRTICCGKVNTNFCPNGANTFMDPLTMTPMECDPRVKSCPSKYICRYNDQQGSHYCCSEDNPSVCPAGKTFYTDPTTKEPANCYVSSTNPCPAGFSCQTSTLKSSHGFCCSIYDLCPNGDKYLTGKVTNLPITCSVSNQTCPVGYTCHSVAPIYDNGHCCQNVMIKREFAPNHNDGCPLGHVPFKQTNQSVKLCELTRSRCPTGYSCHFSTDHNRSQCCGLSAGCPNEAVAFINPSTGLAQNCTLGRPCSKGFSCQQTQHGSFLCCTGLLKVAADACPNGQQIRLNPVTGNPTECLQQYCPDGYDCTFSRRLTKYVCCSNDVPSLDDCPTTRKQNAPKRQPATLCHADIAPCPVDYECVHIAKKSLHQCCQKLLPFENDQALNTTGRNKTCDDTEKRQLGQVCCSDKQCLYACGSYKAEQLCLCPRHLLLDTTKEPYKCSTSCSAVRDGAICRPESKKFPT